MPFYSRPKDPATTELKTVVIEDEYKTNKCIQKALTISRDYSQWEFPTHGKLWEYMNTCLVQ